MTSLLNSKNTSFVAVSVMSLELVVKLTVPLLAVVYVFAEVAANVLMAPRRVFEEAF